MILEDHRLAIRMLRDVVLDESWNIYSPAVRSALWTELRFHHSLTFGATESPGSFDDDAEKLASLQLENFLSAAEADLETQEGEFLSSVGV